MSLKPKINLSGFVLSALMFDDSNSEGDQEGFLIGTITKNVTSEISDQSMCNTQEEILISIYSSVPCGEFLSFYNANGIIRLSDVDSHLGERKPAVVGWYRFRRHSPVFPSMRETAVHKNLRHVFSQNHVHLEECFVYGVLTTSYLQTYATHAYDYAFYNQTPNNSFKPLDVNLLNLGDTRNIYRRSSIAAAYLESSSFNAVLRTPWSGASCMETEELISLFHNKLSSTLENLRDELIASSVVVDTIQNEEAAIDESISELTKQKEKYLKALSQNIQPAASAQNLEDSSKSEEVASIPQGPPTAAHSDENVFKTSEPLTESRSDLSIGIPKRQSDSSYSPESAKRTCYKKYFGQEGEFPSGSTSDAQKTKEPHDKILDEPNKDTVWTQAAPNLQGVSELTQGSPTSHEVFEVKEEKQVSDVKDEERVSEAMQKQVSEVLEELVSEIKEEKPISAVEIMSLDSTPIKELKPVSSAYSHSPLDKQTLESHKKIIHGTQKEEEIPTVLPTEPKIVSGKEAEPLDIPISEGTRASLSTIPVLTLKHLDETAGAPFIILDPERKESVSVSGKPVSLGTISDSSSSAEKAQEHELETMEIEVESEQPSDSSPEKVTSVDDPTPSIGTEESKEPKM